ncbi:MAG: hypothetical protein HEEMFOPI_01265 [Holosporales bacterium]
MISARLNFLFGYLIVFVACLTGSTPPSSQSTSVNIGNINQNEGGAVVIRGAKGPINIALNSKQENCYHQLKVEIAVYLQCLESVLRLLYPNGIKSELEMPFFTIDQSTQTPYDGQIMEYVAQINFEGKENHCFLDLYDGDDATMWIKKHIDNCHAYFLAEEHLALQIADLLLKKQKTVNDIEALRKIFSYTGGEIFRNMNAQKNRPLTDPSHLSDKKYYEHLISNQMMLLLLMVELKKIEDATKKSFFSCSGNEDEIMERSPRKNDVEKLLIDNYVSGREHINHARRFWRDDHQNVGASCVTVGSIPTPFFLQERYLNQSQSYLTALYAKAHASKEGRTVTVIHGAGGMGKSTLAAQYIKEAKENKAYDLIVWINAENERTLKKGYINAIRQMERHIKNNDQTFIKSSADKKEDIKDLIEHTNGLLTKYRSLESEKICFNSPLFIFHNAPGYKAVEPIQGQIEKTEKKVVQPPLSKKLTQKVLAIQTTTKLISSRFFSWVFSFDHSKNQESYSNVAPYLPDVGHVIVTTQMNPGNIPSAIHVDCFSAPEAAFYIQKSLNIQLSQTLSQNLIEKIKTAGVYHPLALSSFSCYMNSLIAEGRRVATDELILEQFGLFNTENGIVLILKMPEFKAFKDMFATSYTALTDEEKHVFNFLCYLDGEDVKTYDCAYLLSSTSQEIEESSNSEKTSTFCSFFRSSTKKKTKKVLTIYNDTFGTLAEKGFITVQYGQHELESATITPFYKRLGRLKINQDNAAISAEEKITENTYLEIFVKNFKFIYDFSSRFSVLFLRYKEAIGLKNVMSVFDKNGTRCRILFNHLGIDVKEIMEDIIKTKGSGFVTLSYLPDFVIDSLAKRIITNPSEDPDLPTFKEIFENFEQYGIDKPLRDSIENWVKEQRKRVFNDRSIPTVCTFLTTPESPESPESPEFKRRILNLSKRLKIRKLLLTLYPTTERSYLKYEDNAFAFFNWNVTGVSATEFFATDVLTNKFYDYMRYVLSIHSRWSVNFIDFLVSHDNLFKKLNDAHLYQVLSGLNNDKRAILYREKATLTPEARRNKQGYDEAAQAEIDGYDSPKARELLEKILNYSNRSSMSPSEKRLFNQQMLRYKWFEIER